jgi:hypothetical protein
MPGFALYMGALWFVTQEYRLEELERMRADDDGMAQPYIRLEGVQLPRALSWAEERALRDDLVNSAPWRYTPEVSPFMRWPYEEPLT